MEQLVLEPEDHKLFIDKNKMLKSNLTSYDSTSYYIKAFIPKKIDQESLTITYLFNLFGTDPIEFEPCFYNQDWYLKESFANTPLKGDKMIEIEARIPKENFGFLPSKTIVEKLPSALELTYIFFLVYLKYGIVLWKYDYLWTSDFDEENDQIYVGRYYDPKGLVKNGFSIHRHLSIKSNYGHIQGK